MYALQQRSQQPWQQPSRACGLCVEADTEPDPEPGSSASSAPAMCTCISSCAGAPSGPNANAGTGASGCQAWLATWLDVALLHARFCFYTASLAKTEASRNCCWMSGMLYCACKYLNDRSHA
jgi:hypothetical protein